jgi:two-component system chemotaxis sensor kinase CheA
MVEQRTIELKDANNFMALMMNSLDQGFLVFDDELLCNPMFTKACEPIFGVSPFGKTIIDVLSVTDEGNAQNLRQWAKVLFSEMIPFESAIDLGPREKVTGNSYTDENYKYVNIDYYPMRDSDEKISNVVMIATDKTNEVQAREIAKEKESYVYMILKILNNKTQFESFVNEVEGIFHQFNKVYSVEDGTIDFNLCMMLFHTLNGGFGIYSINKIQQIAREYETGISNIKDTNPNLLEYIPVLDGQVEHLRNEFLNFRIELDKLVGTKFASNQSLSEIPRYKILEFKELVAQSENIDLRNYFDENFLKVPIIDYFKAYDDLCITTAAKINKQFLGLTFHNSELKIEAESLLEFFNVLVHLFRNCLDHGLEEASTRLSLGKTAEGHIEVSFNEIENFDKKILSVIIQDDGAGINPEIIRARCEKLNPSEDISGLSDKEVIYQIFAPFFSTRDEVSALSGRGVGMSAIKEVVDRLQGEIEINSQVGVGTVFSFSIPIS